MYSPAAIDIEPAATDATPYETAYAATQPDVAGRFAHLAYEAPKARTTEQIAAATKVKTAYLSKVLQGLTRAGILRSQRGIGGGIALVKRPDELTILEVVNAVEPIQRIKSPPCTSSRTT